MATALPRPLSGNIDDGWRLEVGSTVTFLCASIIVGFRTLARAKYARLSWDDYLMLFALAQALVATILDFVAVHWGLGRHLYYLSPVQRVQQEYYSLLSQVFCVNALTFAKISICLSYLRVLRGSYKKGLRLVCYATAVLVFAVNTVVIISFYAQCDPPAKSWNQKIPGKCWKPPTEISLVLLQGSFSALTDFFLSALPIFMFKDLRIGKKSKAILCGLMGLGTITGIFALVRTAEAASAVHSRSTDVSFSIILGLMWAGMERNIAIMVASSDIFLRTQAGI
ncbi:MAG: hypothetical protein ASARMPREDX12_008485 [Alectoria sarmentosa]|nr:MAG: hypothetical protein ASARMPREDX12_008485 [Alectoria sarmentosa]